jgi:hypothetical protein
MSMFSFVKRAFSRGAPHTESPLLKPDKEDAKSSIATQMQRPSKGTRTRKRNSKGQFIA